MSICANKKNIHQNVKYEKIEQNGLSDYLDNRVSKFDDFDYLHDQNNIYSKEQKLAIEERKTKLKNKSHIIKQNLSKLNKTVENK